MRTCGECGEQTDRPVGAVGQGCRTFYGRLCACDRQDGEFRNDVNIVGVGPMAEYLGVSRKQFARIRDRDAKRFHTYLDDNTADVTSLQAWYGLYAETLVAGVERRQQNLRQFNVSGGPYAQPWCEIVSETVPENVPAATQNQSKTTPRRSPGKRKTR